MAKRPSRIDLLELDIDLRLAELWREASEVGEWKLDIVAAFMRAAYGKGYCDALTEESPGLLCQEHGYRVPVARVARFRGKCCALSATCEAHATSRGVPPPGKARLRRLIPAGAGLGPA